MLHRKVRIGFLGARCDNGGLGIESKYFIKHINPEKIMVVVVGNHKAFPDRFPNATIVKGIPTDKQIEDFVKDIDVLFCIETPYNWNAFRIARKHGVKTVMRINYEWLPFPTPSVPDVMINPVDWYMHELPENAVYLKFPVDRSVIPFKKRKKAKTFLHIVGHGGGYGRNGTQELLKAIPMVKSDVRFIIYSQVNVEKIDDDRIEWRIGNYMNEGELFNDGDVFLFPRKYAGQALSMNEAMASGMAIMMTDMKPQNKILPKELLISPKEMTEVFINRNIEMAILDPKDIAKKIDEWANKDISRFSEISNKIANEMSWKTLRSKYIEILQ
ncbi:MAG: glycosyltransferase family 4 protein [Saprospiraceae bacterium]|nr:glycosyltransferase family 4 protein [Saprospiraceae bacterium]